MALPDMLNDDLAVHLSKSRAMQQVQNFGGGVGMKRQATWDALPDIDFFSIPVDDFFETYVEELGARGSGLQQDVLAGTPVTSGSLDPVLEHFPHTGTQQMDGLVTPGLAPTPQQQFPYAGTQHLDGLMTPELAQAPQGHGFQPGGSSQNGMPALPLEPLQSMANLVTSGFEAPIHQRSGSGSQGSGNWAAAANKGSGNLSNEDSPEDGDGDSTPGARNGSKRQTKAKRNARQQDQNKQAQQRYRERRKQKFQEMEQALEQLQSQVQEMHTVQSNNAALQGKAKELENKLLEKEMEVEALRTALAKANTGQDVHVVGPVEKMECAPIKHQECDRYRAEKEKRREEETMRLQREFAANTDTLRAFVDQHNLRNVDPSGAGVPRDIVARVGELVSEGCQLCQSAMRAEGIKVLALMSRDVAQMAHISCHIERAKWERIVDVLRLTEPQAEQLLELRKVHLRNLRELFEDRQRLNLQAMSLMLPKNVGRRQIPDASTLESRMDCMKITSSYSCVALSNVHLDSILDDIKSNLRKEQRTVMELNYTTMHKVLTPIQSGLFVVEAFPGHPDCLALGNILARRRGGEPGAFECQEPTSSEEISETCSMGS
ncbi:g4486 [Coccomyxa elongata]